MASVIRIKRRRTDDPIEALLLSQIKKSRTTVTTETATEAENQNKIESVLEFAGTLDSKEESISKHIKEAIRRKKIHKQMHPHSSDFKIPLDRDQMTKRIRKQKAESSHNKRYRITCSRRTLDIDNLDCCTDGESDNVGKTDNDEDPLQQRLSQGDENKKNSQISKTADAKVHLESQKDSSESVDNKNEHNSNLDSPKAICGAICGKQDKKEDDKIYCLFDVEHDKQINIGVAPSASEITVNGVPMKSVKTTDSEKVPVMEESDDYVYDLYYTHTRLGHIPDEAVLTVEALCNEFLHDERGDEGDDFVYDDEDDSNDEGNWRNDYPDEDPHFFENAERDYDFENNMRESNFDGDDDEGDLLSYWMDTRCRIDVDCNDFEDDDYDKYRSSSDEEAGAEMGYY